MDFLGGGFVGEGISHDAGGALFEGEKVRL